MSPASTAGEGPLEGGEIDQINFAIKVRITSYALTLHGAATRAGEATLEHGSIMSCLSAGINI